MPRGSIVLAAIFVSLSPISSFADVRYVRAGDDLQAALNAARPGDELRLAPDTTFSGNFVLPVTTGTATITVRTDLPDIALPGPRQRVTPVLAARFARIASPSSGAALRTAPGAHDWRFMFVVFPNTKDGFGDIVQLGDGSRDQNDLTMVPSNFEFDRVYIHGDRLQGQKRGIALNARGVTIRNSYISDIKAVGVDTQAIGGWNGPGPFVIENNYLEASGEVVLLGGSDPGIQNLVSEDVIVRFNHMTRPISWRDPIVTAPSNVVATGSGTGSLSAGVYAYRVVARRRAGAGQMAGSLPSSEVTAVATSGAVTVNWTAVADASEYVVYARTPAGTTESWTVTSPSFLHNGATAGKAGTPPTSATRWQVKNLFELKNARRVRIEYNLFENNWEEAQVGYAVLLTPRNQDGRCTWCGLDTVTFSHNVIRNSAGGFNITGYDSDNVSAQSTDLTIQDNYVQLTKQLGGTGWGFLVGQAPRNLVIDHNTIDSDGNTVLYVYGGSTTARTILTGFQFTNNAARHGEYGVNGAAASTGTLTFQMFFPTAVFTGNWLSGGNSSRYPPGNTFEEPFDIKATSSSGQRPGANVFVLLRAMEGVKQGSMPPTAPTGLHQVILSTR
jgi:hypothetical protein